MSEPVPHLEVLPKPALALLRRLGGSDWTQTLYLAGGTACALHLGHRPSQDLDFFSRDPVEPRRYRDGLAALGPLEVHGESPGTLHATLARVKISVMHFASPLLDPTITVEGVRVAGLRDLALMKLSAISQRGARRDFVDLHAICRATRLGVKDLLRLCGEKFPGVEFSDAHFLRGLVYFTDADAEPSPRMLQPLDWKDVKRFFEREARAALA